MSITSDRPRLHRGLLVAGAIVLPALILSVYLLVSRTSSPWLAPWTDYVAFAVALVAGAACVWALLPRAPWRIPALLVYGLSGARLLFLFAFYFVCAAFGDCL
jgi:hypothetical protein